MIDLSYLTEEEQDRILAVLKRDAELKKAEEQRIQTLQKSVEDKGQLKYLTGDWFYETKSRRHRDRIHGSDIIRASIRQRRPVAVMELSQVWADMPSLVNSDNQEVFAPPELAGLMDDPRVQPSCERTEDRSPSDRPQDTLKPGSQSPFQQRQNPFNSSPTPVTLVMDTQLTNGGMEQTKTPDRDQHEHGHAESLDPQVSDFHLTDQESGKPDHPGSSTEDEGHSMANVREWFVWSLRQRAAPQTNLPEQPSDKPEMVAAATSDTKPPSDAGSKNAEESHAVSPKPRRGLLGMFSRGESPETQSPVEVTMSEEGELGDAISNFNTQSAASTSVQPQSEFPGQLTDQPEILAAAISDAKSPSDAGSKKSPQTMSPKPRKGLLGIFRRRESKERSPEARSEVEEDATASEERQPQEAIANLTVSQSTTTQQYQQGTDTQTQSDETVETAVFQSKGSIKPVISVETEDQHEVVGVEGEADKFPQKLANLESFLEKESSDLNILTGKPSSDAMAQKPVFIGHGDPYDQKMLFNEDFPKTEIRKGSLCLLDSDPSARRKSDALENSNIAFSKIPCEDKSSPSVECSPLLNTPSVDGTFIARPILVVDEADGPAEGSTVKQQDELATTLSVHPSDLSPKQQGGVPEPQLGLTPREQETKKENIVPFWKKENGGPRNLVDKPTEPADSQTQPCSEKPPVGLAVVLAFSDIGATERLRETDDHEESSSLYRSTSSTAVSTAKDRVEKGIGSTDKPQSRSYNSLWDKHVDQQTPFNTETLPQEQLLSPITPLPRSRIPKLKDPTDDEVKRSPAKTCHPKALPREPTNHKGSGQDCSPFKTFPIDITPPSKERTEDVEKATLKVRQIKGPSHEAKPVVKPRVEIPSPSQPISIEQREQHHVTPPQRDSEQRSLTAKKPLPHPTQSIPLPATRTGLGSLNARQGPSASPHRDPEDGLIREQLAIRDLETPELAGTPGECESDLGSSLARPFVPKDVQRDVPPLDTHVPQDTNVPQGLSETVAELDVGPNPTTGSLSESEESQHTESEESPHAERSPSSLGSSRSSTPTAQSGAASPGSYHAERSPMRDLKQISSKLKASSKSLEDVTSRITSSVLSPPSPVQLDQRRLSVSVPDLPQDQEEPDVRDGDSASESSFSLDGRATAGSLTNLSLSSGLASMSSISGSAVSVYNVDFGEVEVKGTVRFALNYVQKLAEFHIFVVHCRELAVAERKKNRSDPYVKCYLLPDKAKLGKRKTSVKKKTLNPTFNEILRFKVTMEALKAQKLNVSVWHNDSFGRNNFLGEVDLDLSTWDFSNTQMNDYALKPRVSTQTPAHPLSVDHRGEMRVALRFLQQASYSKRSPKTGAGEVQVWVKDCRNLPPVRGVVIDPFVKCTVLPDASRKGRQKTRVVKRTSSPMFNHTMAFQGFSLEDLDQACVEVTVWDHDRLSNHFIGGLRVGPGTGTSYGAEVHWMDSTAEEAGLWERMTHSQSEWVEEVLPLRMLLMARGVAK